MRLEKERPVGTNCPLYTCSGEQSAIQSVQLSFPSVSSISCTPKMSEGDAHWQSSTLTVCTGTQKDEHHGTAGANVGSLEVWPGVGNRTIWDGSNIPVCSTHDCKSRTYLPHTIRTYRRIAGGLCVCGNKTRTLPLRVHHLRVYPVQSS